MDQEIKNEDKKQLQEGNLKPPAMNDKYAQSLIDLANIQMKQNATSEKKTIFTKKFIYITLSIILTILSLLWISVSFGNNNDTSEQILNGTDYVHNLEQ